MRPNTLEDVWRHVQKRTAVECWEWCGALTNTGYGRFSLKGKTLLAHRAVYELGFGEIPEGLFVMHKCNNKACCNPDHLTLGTNSENQRHASHSGAHAAGASGIRGISFDRRRQYWKANAYLNGKNHNLYTGPSRAKAIAARDAWDHQHSVHFKGDQK